MLAWEVLVKREAGNTSLIVGDILSMPVCIDCPRMVTALNPMLSQQDKARLKTFYVHVYSLILGLIVPEV